MTDFANMGKTELRAACKLASIKNYSKMDNAGMRAALEAVVNTTFQEGVDYDSNQIRDVDCPSCGIGLDNGVLHRSDEAYSEGGSSTGRTLYQEGMTKEWECMGCGAQFGTECEPYVATPSVDRHSGTGLKIEANRPERNGIKRPSVGGKCRAIWDYLDTAPTSTAKDVRKVAGERGWNPNNAIIEFYQWRKYNA